MGAVMLIAILMLVAVVGVLAWRVVLLERAILAAKMPDVTRELADFRAKAEIITSGRKLLRERLELRANASRASQ
jgi:Na+-transporting NADH:ubiquinone oxidoreductase subunit NqrF